MSKLVGSWPTQRIHTHTHTRLTALFSRTTWLKDRLPSKELRERLGIDDIALVLQQNRLHWYGHVLRKDDDDWVKKCMEYEVECPRPRGRPKRTWREVVREDCQAHKLNKEDAMDRCKWRKMIQDVRWSRWVWVGECFFWYRPTRVVPDKRPLNACVRACMCTWVSQYQKGETNLDFTEARDREWQWYQLSHMQVCISLQTDNHASAPPLKFWPTQRT